MNCPECGLEGRHAEGCSIVELEEALIAEHWPPCAQCGKQHPQLAYLVRAIRDGRVAPDRVTVNYTVSELHAICKGLQHLIRVLPTIAPQSHQYYAHIIRELEEMGSVGKLEVVDGHQLTKDVNSTLTEVLLTILAASDLIVDDDADTSKDGMMLWEKVRAAL